VSGDGGGDDTYVALVTGPDRETLAGLGRRVVEERLCACANVLPGVLSVYRWEGTVEEDPEALALLKTTGDALDALRDRVLELHPYDEPEFVALRVDGGSASYLGWIADSVDG
jgi:periplasmic divalent cation tolerance protein